MATAKKTVAKVENTAAKAAAPKVEEKAAEVKKVAEVKAAEVKKVAEVKATEVKKVAEKKVAEVKKAAEKKVAPAKKAVAKKATKKAELQAAVYVQFSGKSYSQEDLMKMAKDVWKYDLKQKATALESVELYVKPEENMVYYVMNKEFTGSFFI